MKLNINYKMYRILLISVFVFIPVIGMSQGIITRDNDSSNGHLSNNSKPKINTIPVSLSLACNVNGIKKNYTVTEWKNLSVFERIKCDKIGLLIKTKSETFLFSLNPLPNWSNWEIAKARSGNQMPTKTQWQIIKQNKHKVQNALIEFGGGSLESRRWWNSGENPSWTVWFNDGTKYDKASPLKDDAGVWLATNDLEIGFKEIEITITHSNKEYDFVGDPSNCGIRVVRHSNKYGFINKKGNIIVPLKYDEVGYNNDWLNNKAGNDKIQWHYPVLMSVSQNGKWGFVNKQGELVTPLIYDAVKCTSHIDNTPSWVSKEGKYGCVDTLGNVIVPLLYDSEIEFYNNQPAKVKKDGKWGFINEQGDVIVPFNYTSTLGFGWNNNLSQVSINDKYGFVNKTGDIVIPIEYDFADSFCSGLAGVVINGKIGFIDESGLLVIPAIYDLEFSSDGDGKKLGFAMDFSYGDVALVKKNGLYGMIDKTGRNITPFKYERISRASTEGHFTAHIGNQTIFLDRGGNEYTTEKERREKSDSVLAGQGYSYEQFKIGRRLYKEKKYANAYLWIKKSAEGGNNKGQCHLGYYYYYGYAPINNQDYKLALNWFLKSALSGNRDACYFIGWMYEHGQGVQTDKMKAIEWYEKSKNQRDSKDRIENLLNN